MLRFLQPLWKKRLLRARAHRKSGDVEAAEQLIRQVQNARPDRVEVATEAAEIAAARRDWDLAIERWRTVIDLNGAPARLRWWGSRLAGAALAWLLGRRGDTKSADAKGALRAYRRLAETYRWAGQLEPARQTLRDALAQSKAFSSRASSVRDHSGTCFVLSNAHRGWILEKIARVIAQHVSNPRFVYLSSTAGVEEIPEASSYFFMHHQLLCNALLAVPSIWNAAIHCFYTHPSESYFVHPDHVPLFLNEIEHTIVQNSHTAANLCESGADPERLSVILGGADPTVFVGHTRGHGKLGFVSGYYERKNPAMLLELAKAMPEEQFLLLGPSAEEITHGAIYWPNAAIFDALMSQPNIEYREARYEDYPRHFADIDVFLMLSKLEGGPIPLLEAMMSNCVPVATDTGFAADLIAHGDNGYLAATDAPTKTFVALILQARANEVEVRETVTRYSWGSYGAAIAEKMKEHPRR